jgi:hypothetical protein
MTNIGDKAGVFEVNDKGITGVKLVKCQRWYNHKFDIYDTFAHVSIKNATIVVPHASNLYHYNIYPLPHTDLRTDKFVVTEIEKKEGISRCTNYHVFYEDIPRKFYDDGREYTSKLDEDINHVCYEGLHFFRTKEDAVKANYKPSFNYAEYLKNPRD